MWRVESEGFDDVGAYLDAETRGGALDLRGFGLVFEGEWKEGGSGSWWGVAALRDGIRDPIAGGFWDASALECFFLDNFGRE